MSKLEFKGTPGPWDASTIEFDLADNCQGAIHRTYLEGSEHKSTFVADVATVEDSNLIAAAPALLAAAIDFVEKVDSGRAYSKDSYMKFKLAVHAALNIKE